MEKFRMDRIGFNMANPLILTMIYGKLLEEPIPDIYRKILMEVKLLFMNMMKVQFLDY
jgi:hypothetical protein